LLSISMEMAPEEIDRRSRVQHRGRFSIQSQTDENPIDAAPNGCSDKAVKAIKETHRLVSMDKRNSSVKPERLGEWQLSFSDFM